MISDSVLNRYQNNWKIKSDHVKAPHWPDYQAYSSAATLTNARRAFLCVKAWKVYWSYEVLSEEHFWASCSRKNKSNDWTGFSNKVSAKPYSDSTFLRRFHLETFEQLERCSVGKHANQSESLTMLKLHWISTATQSFQQNCGNFNSNITNYSFYQVKSYQLIRS